jgi:hypothetical protein
MYINIVLGGSKTSYCKNWPLCTLSHYYPKTKTKKRNQNDCIDMGKLIPCKSKHIGKIWLFDTLWVKKFFNCTYSLLTWYYNEERTGQQHWFHAFL